VRGKVMIIDDVISAGTSVRESIVLITQAGGAPHAVAIALDRQGKATEAGRDVDYSAVQYVENQLGLQVCSIARLADLLHYLAQHSGDALGGWHAQVLAYRERYGIG
jgi:orotate phosphoribosyltransferase